MPKVKIGPQKVLITTCYSLLEETSTSATLEEATSMGLQHINKRKCVGTIPKYYWHHFYQTLQSAMPIDKGREVVTVGE